jgi:hypothetical protein
MAPDCRVHVENGDERTPLELWEYNAGTRLAMPDLTVDIDGGIFPGERMVLQVTLRSTLAQGLPVLQAGQRTSARCAIVCIPGDDLRLREVWTYLNPGFPFTFPPAGLRETPPPEDGAGDEEARALYERWVERASAGDDFLTAVTSTFAPGGVVHLGNGDDGGVEALRDLFGLLVRAMPDLSLDVEAVTIGDRRAIVQFLLKGTHSGGPLGPYQASGRVLPSRGMVIARPNRAAQTAEFWLYIAPMYSVAVPPRGPR